MIRLMPGAFVIRAMSAAALTLSNLSCHEIRNYSLDLTPHSQENLDIIFAEEIYCPWPHASCEDVRNLF